MRQTIRMVMAIVLGLATLLVGQLAIEVVAWWWTAETTSFDTPLLNAVKFTLAAAAALAVGATIARPSRCRASLV